MAEQKKKKEKKANDCDYVAKIFYFTFRIYFEYLWKGKILAISVYILLTKTEKLQGVILLSKTISIKIVFVSHEK